MQPITTSPINRLPAAFLGFVDVKAMGSNPRFLESQVRPILDMRPHYMASGRITRISANVAVAGGGVQTFPDMLVPTNKAWLLESLVANGPTLGGADELDFEIVLRNQNGTVVYMGERFANRLNDRSFAALNFLDSIYVALPGYQLSVNVSRFVFAAPPFNLQLVATFTEADF